MKPGSIGDLDFYLGANLKTKRLSNSVLTWSMSSSKYIQVAIQNVKDYVNMTCLGQDLPKHASGPFPSGYVSKLDMSANATISMHHSTSHKLAHYIGVLS
jgi:hypothetical protein